ncbi:MAG TPA: HEAT repeat domain-containing protein [Gemmatimonadaceae bacterium]|nr:HEAT repeat domain-containing protein [Gemmatimonadaceae bacterium]
MIRALHTLRAVAVLAVVTAVAGAQNPPVPIPPPTPPSPPSPRSAPMPAPVITPRIGPLDLHMAPLDLRIDVNHAVHEALVQSRVALEHSRVMSHEAMEHANEQVRRALEDARIDGRFPAIAPMPAIPPIDMPSIAVPGRSLNFGPFYQSDPADSLYKQAGQLFNSSDFRAAAQRFKELQQRYPNSQYISQSMYYQSMALYRAGSDAELREALSVIEARQQRFPNARNEDPTLPTRIRRMLAERGDAGARSTLQQQATSGTQSCDREEMQVRMEALSGLQRMDPAAAQPALERVLARRDECSLNLRRAALQILTRQGDEKSVATLISVAKNDPSPRMRADAMEFVAKFPNDEVFAMLENAARTETNESIRSAAARNLVGYPTPRARQAARSIIEDNTIPDNVRREMLGRYNNERGTAEDAAWLRAAFPRVTSPSVRGAIVGAVSRIGGADSQRWLMDIASSDQETVQLRSYAFRAVAGGMTTPDLIRAYDNTAARSMRQSVAGELNKRKEPEALDKLIDILKRSTDPEVRNHVLNMLTDRNDPKVKAALLELIDRSDR